MRKGTKMTQIQCQRIREGLKKKYPQGRVAWNKGQSNYWAIGERNVNWKGGRTKEDKLRVKREYAEEHPDKLKQWKKQYHEAHKREPEYILVVNLRKTLLKKLGSKTEKARQSSVDYLGCTIGELRKYLEGKFQEGMNWENHGTYGWHIDHQIPLSFFDLSMESNRHKAFHYSNLQPLWSQQNLRKHKKLNYKYD